MTLDEGKSDAARKLKGVAWLVGGVLFVLGLVYDIAPLVRLIPWSWEEKIAEQLPGTPAGKVCSGSEGGRAQLQKLVARLYPLDADDTAFAVHVEIVKNADVNAFAGLGGHITVFSGLLNQAHSPDELAGFLAHEMEHVKQRHVLRGALVPVVSYTMSWLATGDTSSGAAITEYLLRMGYSREQEAEADEGGLKRLRRAHVDTRGFQNFFERMKKSSSVPAFLSDHPSYESRFEMAAKYQSDDIKPIMTHAEWLQLQNFCK